MSLYMYSRYLPVCTYIQPLFTGLNSVAIYRSEFIFNLNLKTYARLKLNQLLRVLNTDSPFLLVIYNLKNYLKKPTMTITLAIVQNANIFLLNLS